jgi:uncharacterized BrkB/YihY/UPF0761 family membrane protein
MSEPVEVEPSECNRGTLLFAGAAFAITAGFSALNIYYLNQAKHSRLTNAQIDIALIINVVLLVIAVILFFFIIYRILFTRETRTRIESTVGTYLAAPPTGLIGAAPAAVAVAPAE